MEKNLEYACLNSKALKGIRERQVVCAFPHAS